MSEAYLGQISIYSFNFAPKGFAQCNGQFLPINQNQALFSLLGTTYGGNGQTTFQLPNLQGRVGLHAGQSPGGSSFNLGERAGEASRTLATTEMPAHEHGARFSSTTNSLDPSGKYWAPNTDGFITFATTAPDAMSPNAIGPAGGSQPHDNMAPYLTLNFCIALQGIFPSRN
jgi:microcystin-dependent protein